VSYPLFQAIGIKQKIMGSEVRPAEAINHQFHFVFDFTARPRLVSKRRSAFTN
jgi:hypothetical protein